MLSRPALFVVALSTAFVLLGPTLGLAQNEDPTEPQQPRPLTPLMPLTHGQTLTTVEQGKLTKAVYEQTKTASKLTDFVSIAEQCEAGLEKNLSKKNADYLRSLQGWALNRCGEKRTELALELDRIGSHKRAQENFTEALENFLQATIAAPQRHRTWNSWGISLVQQGNYAVAVEKFDEAIRRKTDYVAAYFNRAEANAQLKQFQQAITDYTFVLRMNSDDIESLNGRGLAYLGGGQHSKAIADFERAITLDAKSGNLWVNCGDAKAASGQWQAALSDYAKAAQLDESGAGDQRAAWVLATYPKEELRDGERAVALIEGSLQRGNRTAKALETLAAARASIGEFDKACQNQEQAIALVSAETEPAEASPIKVRLALYQSEKPFIEQASETRDKE